MITVNKDNKNKKVDEAYETALATIKHLANEGQETFIIRMNLPNYSDGHDVFDRLKHEGVKVCESGFCSSKNSNGSYTFFVTCKIEKTRKNNVNEEHKAQGTIGHRQSNLVFSTQTDNINLMNEELIAALVKPYLENCACLGRDAYQCIDKFAKGFAKEIIEEIKKAK